MKAVVFASEAILGRLIFCLIKEGFDVLSTSGGSEAIALLDQVEFDLAVVYSSMEDAEAICRRIRELRDVPVVLMVTGKKPEWEELPSLEPNGYIVEGERPIVVAAKLRSILHGYLRKKK